MAELSLVENFDETSMTTRRDILNELLSSTYTSLNPEQLIIAFIADLRKTIDFEGAEYKEATLVLHHIDGELADHNYCYDLKFRGLCLGELHITSNDPFLEREIIILENKMAGLVMPLFHALSIQQAIRESDRDELTGLMDGSSCHCNIDLSINRAIDHNNSFSLLNINVDDFNKINAVYGHDAGDALLIELTKRIEKEIQCGDVVFRVGADEFIILLPDTGKFDAIVIAEEIKRSVLKESYRYKAQAIDFTVCMGVVTAQPLDEAFKVLDRAEKSLSHAKRLGKNRIQVCSFSDNERYELKIDSSLLTRSSANDVSSEIV